MHKPIHARFFTFRRWAQAAVAASLAVGVFTAAQADTLSDIKSRGKLIVGVKADYKPFGYVDANGKNVGLEIDIAHYLALKLLGSPDDLQLVPVTASNRIEYLRQGRIDLTLATMSDTKKRQQVIDFSRDYYASGTALMTRKQANIHSWADAKGKKVCGIQGSFYNTELSKRGIQMVNYPSTSEVYKALKDHRCIGFAYDDSALVGKLLDPAWGKTWHIATPAILETPWGIGIRKGEDALKKQVDGIVKQMESSGYIYALQTKWGIPHTDYVKKAMQDAQQNAGN